MVWKKSKHGLLHLTDETREDLQIRIKAEILEDLKEKSVIHNTTVSYLIENGLLNMMPKDDVSYNASTRNKGKVYFKATLQKDIIHDLKKLSEEKGIKITNIIDESANHIDYKTLKDAKHRFRIE
jgi:hypothetical protein